MMKSYTKSYIEMRDYLDTVPVIETHEHYTGFRKIKSPALFGLLGYYTQDACSAALGPGMEKEVAEALFCDSLPLEERVDIFNKFYKRSNKTAYARGLQIGMKECWGITEFDKKTFLEFDEKFSYVGQDFYIGLMKRYGIKAKIVDSFFSGTREFIEGKNKEYSEFCRFAFPLPELHNIHNSSNIYVLENYIDRKITCLEDYLESVENYMKKAVEFGVVSCKDQSAYRRNIAFGNSTRSEAEKAFNEIISHPRDTFGDNEVRVLDDWLFHQFIRLARKFNLPVQVHTGHMAGLRNDIVKTNAAHFIPVLEQYTDVGFDLFHGNWPYMDEFLFIGKNYPNVYLDLCWVQIIDPIYCIELMKRAVMTVPHSKVMAFGGDTNTIELVVGYLILARDNVACALSQLVDSGWINMQEAKEIAADWFFNNPNEFFKLGFERF